MRQIRLNVTGRYNALSLRERVLVAATALTITWGLWISSIGGDVIDNRAVVITDIDRVELELTRQHDERQQLMGGAHIQRTRDLEEERGRLVAELEFTDAELEQALSRFVAPEDVAGLLEDVIAGHEDLTLLRIESQPAQALRTTAQTTLSIYRHPVQVELAGSYMGLLAYLEDLESSGWGLSWRKLEYVVDDYPHARVLLEVETLSRERDWLGV